MAEVFDSVSACWVQCCALGYRVGLFIAVLDFCLGLAFSFGLLAALPRCFLQSGPSGCSVRVLPSVLDFGWQCQSADCSWLQCCINFCRCFRLLAAVLELSLPFMTFVYGSRIWDSVLDFVSILVLVLVVAFSQ